MILRTSAEALHISGCAYNCSGSMSVDIQMRPHWSNRLSRVILGLMALLLLTLPTPIAAQDDYHLGTGDRVRVQVFGEDDLSGEFKVGDTGKIAMPLIGEVSAAGLTASQLEAAVIEMLRPDYLISPSVAVEVMNYRPFFIMGEVRSPGSYPYVNGISVLEAVALAGGFTYRARQNEVYITRGSSDDSEALFPVDSQVLPGDVIRVRERFF